MTGEELAIAGWGNKGQKWTSRGMVLQHEIRVKPSTLLALIPSNNAGRPVQFSHRTHTDHHPLPCSLPWQK